MFQIPRMATWRMFQAARQVARPCMQTARTCTVLAWRYKMATKSAVPWQWAAWSACGALGLSIATSSVWKPAIMEGALVRSVQEDRAAIIDHIKKELGGLPSYLLPWELHEDGKAGRVLRIKAGWVRCFENDPECHVSCEWRVFGHVQHVVFDSMGLCAALILTRITMGAYRTYLSTRTHTCAYTYTYIHTRTHAELQLITFSCSCSPCWCKQNKT